MNLDRAEMTDRILAAIENPYTQIIAHPTGRLVLRREPFDYDMEKVLDAAADHGVAMEANAYPDRLDLSRRSSAHGQAARMQNRDLHRLASTGNLLYMKYGVRPPAAAGSKRRT